MKLFTLDSPIGRTIATLADLVILNLLFLFSCMPILTVGAACAGLYHTVNAILMGECGILYKTYLEGFKACFKRGTLLFLITGALAAMVVFDAVCAIQLQNLMGMLSLGVILASGILVLGVMALLPMVLMRDPRAGVMALLRRSFLLAMKGTWRTILAVVLNLIPLALFLFAPALFLESWMFWFLIGFAALAYVNNWLLLRDLDPESWQRLKPVKKEKT